MPLERAAKCYRALSPARRSVDNITPIGLETQWDRGHVFRGAYGEYRRTGARFCHACLRWITEDEADPCPGPAPEPCHACAV
jgi:hypothetical protein